MRLSKWRLPTVQICLLLVLGVLTWPVNVYAEERILSFDQTITVLPDGILDVTEVITVVAEGQEIQRGIFRNLPLSRSDETHGAVSTPYFIVSVRKNGDSEPYFTERSGNDLRLYIGQRDVLLRNGTYRYEIRYRTGGQLRRTEDGHPLLYWNVNGLDWSFRIEEVTARVMLPGGVSPLQMGASTGRYGQTGSDYAIDDNGTVVRSTRVFLPGEGLTIRAVLPMGSVEVPEPELNAMDVFRASLQGWYVTEIGFFLLLIYCLVVWHKLGRDPEKGVIVPWFDPPDNLTPGAIRYIWTGVMDNQLMGSALISLATKRLISIERLSETWTSWSGGFRLERLPKNQSDPNVRIGPGEQALLSSLGLWHAGGQFDIDKSNRKKIQTARDAYFTAMEREYDVAHFRHNRVWLLIAAVFLVVYTVVPLALLKFETGFLALIMLIITGVVGSKVLPKILTAVRTGNTGRTSLFGIIGALVSGIFCVATIGLYTETPGASVTSAFAVIGGVMTVLVFSELVKRRTLRGREMADQIEGFRMYLSVAEGDRLDAMNPPDKTPEHFEYLLPYAVALGVATEWSDKFNAVIHNASLAEQRHYSFYRSSTLLSDLGSSISTSSSNASSGGGGGISGGGGGGGGGGGW